MWKRKLPLACRGVTHMRLLSVTSRAVWGQLGVAWFPLAAHRNTATKKWRQLYERTCVGASFKCPKKVIFFLSNHGLTLGEGQYYGQRQPMSNADIQKIGAFRPEAGWARNQKKGFKPAEGEDPTVKDRLRVLYHGIKRHTQMKRTASRNLLGKVTRPESTERSIALRKMNRGRRVSWNMTAGRMTIQSPQNT